MASKRTLKQTVNSICNAVLSECIAAYLYSGHIDQKNADALIDSIIGIRNDFVSRISHPEPGMPAKTFYNDLANDFNKQICEVIDQIGNLCE
ncbi:MAG: hypothetical protein IKX36_08160 [Prevotella sp.]|nr:hypothetical protein [Prevotella sp.]